TRGDRLSSRRARSNPPDTGVLGFAAWPLAAAASRQTRCQRRRVDTCSTARGTPSNYLPDMLSRAALTLLCSAILYGAGASAAGAVITAPQTLNLDTFRSPVAGAVSNTVTSSDVLANGKYYVA